MMQRIKNIIEKAKEFDYETLEIFKYLCFGLIVVDLFGIYYYMGWKQLGGAILIVTISFLAVILVLMRSKEPKKKKEVKNMEKTENKSKKEKRIDSLKKELKNLEEPEEEKKEEEKESDLGIPSAKEYNKRMEEAIL